jgi:hypothetical protein
MIYSVLAALVEAVHVAYIAYVVLGLVAILVGAVLRWQWIRNPWFRVSHLVMIGIVAVEALAGWDCPLTVWGDSLRGRGPEEAGAGFIARHVHGLIHFELEPWVFTVVYVGVALLVLSAFWFAPVRWRRAARAPRPGPSPAAGPVLAKSDG